MGRAAILTDPQAAARSGADVAMLTDLSECIGCKACEVACKQWNQNQAETSAFLGSYQSHPGILDNTWTVIKFVEDINESRDMSVESWQFIKTNCMHCTEAGCVTACPVDALTYGRMGTVELDVDKCIGCGYCEKGCPFGAVAVQAQVFDTDKKAGKCTLCVDRITNGLPPACVQTCPTDCIKYGSRDELIRWGRERVAKLKARGFANATLYGENELGGLHQLYVLLDSPEKYGLPVNPQVSPVLKAVRQVVYPLGKFLLGATFFGLLINFFASRNLSEPKDTDAPKATVQS
ncbi:MAG: 4Fe-4S dicluster domain-containing protein [Firmicutes bacterium]|nr:4Fe-4S dicluster domain-containing protein [Bacillota bacterium]